MTLPPPDPAFRWSQEPWGPALRCQRLEAVARHLFTARQPELPPAEESGAREPAWTEATVSLGAGPERLMRVKQVHGRTVRVLSRGAVSERAADERPAADALVSNESGLVLAVQVADCVPILAADARSRAAVAVHAGWRGMCVQVAEGAVASMVRECGTARRDLIVAIGPSIGPCCYEVGTELVNAFRAGGATDAQLGRWFLRGSNGSLRLDLWTATRDQLMAAGVREDRIFLARLCTRTHADVFESFRADGPRAGRMAAMIRVP